jgi:hypothetical protein
VIRQSVMSRRFAGSFQGAEAHAQRYAGFVAAVVSVSTSLTCLNNNNTKQSVAERLSSFAAKSLTSRAAQSRLGMRNFTHKMPIVVSDRLGPFKDLTVLEIAFMPRAPLYPKSEMLQP